MATLSHIPNDYSGFNQIKKVDVIWFSDTPSLYFFEVEYRSTMRGALHRLYQVRTIETKLIEVGPGENRGKFHKWVDTAPFSSVKNRYTFRSYEELQRYRL